MKRIVFKQTPCKLPLLSMADIFLIEVPGVHDAFNEHGTVNFLQLPFQGLHQLLNRVNGNILNFNKTAGWNYFQCDRG